MAHRTRTPAGIAKTPTGIPGLDAMLSGGLPAGGVTLVVGAAGAGKTVLALQTLARSARDRREAGIFVAFEEPARRILGNAASFGWGLPQLMHRKLLVIDARLPEEAVQSGDFEISGLLANIEARAKTMKARWVVFDAIDILLDLLPDPALRRREVRRLQRWLHTSGLTCIVTAKQQGFSPSEAPAHLYIGYMAECVIQITRHQHDEVTTHWLHVEKYRGSGHTDRSVPFLIGARGIEVDPMHVRSIQHKAYRERLSTGIERMDAMLGGGLLRGSATLVTGAPGTAKTTLAGKLADAACRRGERVLYVCFDESGEEIVRNLSSVRIDLAPHVRSGRLRLIAIASRARSAEAQHAEILREMEAFRPRVLVVDPLSALLKQGLDTVAMDIAYRLVQHSKHLGVTLFATSLTGKSMVDVESSELHVSTLADTWIHLSYLVRSGERNRLLTIVKSRGTGHSNQVRELLLDDSGVTLADVYTEEGEVLLGTLRHQRETAAAEKREQESLARASERRGKQQAAADLAARIRSQQRELERINRDLRAEALQSERAVARRQTERTQISRLRRADRPAARKRKAR